MIAPSDLTQRPPRALRCQLGGYVMLPRLLDKCRAVIAGTNGVFKYGAGSIDRHFFNFTGIDPENLKAEVAAGKSDSEVLEWIEANAPKKHTPWEIGQWSEYQLRRGPDSDAETLAIFAEMVGKCSKTREDIRTWADFLDLDDYCTFGGKP